MADAGLVLRQTMSDIASAIRTKGGASGNLRPSQMAQAILSISGGGGGNVARYSVSVAGGFNGGAVITVQIKGTTIFTATATDTYNLVYDKVSGSQTVDGVEYTVTVTPPANSTSLLGISLSNSEEERTFSVQYDGRNTSYGYNYSDDGTILIPSGGGSGSDNPRFESNVVISSDGTLESDDKIMAFTSGRVKRLATASIWKERLQGMAIASAEFPELVSIEADEVLRSVCSSNSALQSVAFPKLKSVHGEQALREAFYNCTALTSADFPLLEEIVCGSTSQSAACWSAFQKCTGLKSLAFPSLKRIDGYQCCYYCFRGCSALESVDFSALEELGNRSLQECFVNTSSLLSLSFPALRTVASDSFYNAFYSASVTEVHFRADMQATIEALNGYSSCFGRGAGNVTFYFDL